MFANDDYHSLLLDLLRQDIDRGYWKSAIRRYLIMKALNLRVPRSRARLCEGFIELCPKKDLARIEQRVSSWVEMAHGSSAATTRTNSNPAYSALYDMARSEALAG